MGKKRSPVKANATSNDETKEPDKLSAKKPKYEVTDLLEKANKLAEDFNYELASKFLDKALLIEPHNTNILETIGNISAELGNVDDAKEYFMKALALQPDEGHVKYLYLGQLAEGSEAVDFYKKAISMMTCSIGKTSEGMECGNNVCARDVSTVYCSLAELYMTDCCMEEDAEKLCEEACKKALELDGENPEAYLVMCNFILTQGDMEAAKNIAIKMFDVWKSLCESSEDNIVDLMSYECRMTLIKILIEVELYENVSSIGVQLLEENEDDIRIWYYIGLSKSLLNEIEGQRYYLETALFLYEKNGHNDVEMLSHLKELLGNSPPAEEDDICDGNAEGDRTNHTNSENMNGMDVDG